MIKNYTVSEEFIKEAHKAACSTWRTKLEGQFPEVFPRTYTRGDVFIGGYNIEDKTEWILTTMNIDFDNYAFFINKEGSNYSGAHKVKEWTSITEEELIKVKSQGYFKLKQ